MIHSVPAMLCLIIVAIAVVKHYYSSNSSSNFYLPQSINSNHQLQLNLYNLQVDRLLESPDGHLASHLYKTNAIRQNYLNILP